MDLFLRVNFKLMYRLSPQCCCVTDSPMLSLSAITEQSFVLMLTVLQVGCHSAELGWPWALGSRLGIGSFHLSLLLHGPGAAL